MSSYSVADAKNRISELIDRALSGEGVTITRHGTPVVELKPVVQPAKPVTEADLDWLRAHRLAYRKAPTLDSGAFISAMRDEDEH